MKSKVIESVRVFGESFNEKNKKITLFFHGYGDTAENFSQLAPVLSQNQDRDFFFVKAPFKHPLSGDAWFDLSDSDIRHLNDIERGRTIDLREHASYKALSEYLVPFLKKMGDECDDIILGGFSQGCSVAIESCRFLSEPPKALIVFSGSLIGCKSWESFLKSNLLENKPIFQSHGKHDSVIYENTGLELNKVLTQLGARIQWHSFEGGHEIEHSTIVMVNKFLSQFS